jgi:hypothetical protein
MILHSVFGLSVARHVASITPEFLGFGQFSGLRLSNQRFIPHLKLAAQSGTHLAMSGLIQPLRKSNQSLALSSLLRK